MLRAGLTSGTIMAGGDVLCQTIQLRVAGDGCSKPRAKEITSRTAEEDAKSESERGTIGSTAETSGYDLVRTARFGLTGLTLHGPFFNK
jgi:protein Mpv17